jgi:hypothetical protein
MIGLLCLFLALLASPFKSRSRLEAENAALRHQLIILRRKVQGRVCLKNNDRWFLIQLYRWFPSILQALTIVQPETIVWWHRAGFRYLSLPQTSFGWRVTPNWVMLLLNEQYFQSDLAGDRRAFPIEGFA